MLTNSSAAWITIRSAMTRRSHLALGWAVALAAAIFLELVLIHPAMAPDVSVLAPSPSPTAGLPVAGLDPLDRPPRGITRPTPVDNDTAGSVRPPELVALANERAAALQAAIERARLEFHLDALAVAISIPGGIGWSGASGLARDGVTRLTADSPFVIASITKTFTATLVLQLVEEGRLTLDTQVRTLLPGVAVPAGVTVEQLLRHTSGIADLLRPLRPQLNSDAEHRFTPAEVVAAVGAPWWPPGADWGYSNTNYVLLGMIVERMTGKPFAQVLQQRLLTPIGMESSGMLGEPDAPWLMPPAWVTAFWTSGSMYATANDLLRWGDALYDGNVLRPGSRTRMISFDERPYGLGVELLTVGDRTGYGHSGLLRGFTSLLVRLPADDLTLVVLSTGPKYDPARLLDAGGRGKPSILDLALAASPIHPVGELR
jgi:D-alanyl-D-alanine carboxypeptidase